MFTKERDQHETICPRCGGDASWSLLDEEKRRIEIACPDCGRYEMTREEFDQTATEDAQLNEPG